MPHSRFGWHERIKAIEREYRAARIAIDRLTEAVAHDPGVLEGGPKPRDLDSTNQNLEGTYLIRMFAEFETGVRSYWRWIKRKPHARIGAEVLLDRVRDIREVPDDVLREAHRVRIFRNKLTHDRDEDVEPVTIADARHHLSSYFSRLPNEWGQ